MNSKTGMLYIVATPIGNLGDFSPRAEATLREAHRRLETGHARGKLTLRVE